MIVRDATPGDIPAIAAYWNPLIETTTITFATSPRSPADLAAMLAERPWFLVAEDGGQVIGHATSAQFRDGEGYAPCHEHTIMVDPDAHAAGVGRALMAALEDRARAAGVAVMVGAICGENAAAVSFHADLGYIETGRMPRIGRKFGRWLDLVLMQKTL